MYIGCVTAHDAMSNGIPTVTLPSNYIRFILIFIHNVMYYNIRSYILNILALFELYINQNIYHI